jgi:hypothetical protein
MRNWVVAFAALALAAADAGAALFPRQRVEGEYRQALARWAAGDDDGALAAVAALARQAKADDTTGRLARARRSVARSLGRREPQALLAIARLETRAYQAAVTARQPEAALASRLLAAELAEQHAERRDRDGRTAAAALLASLGGHLHQASQEVAAADLSQRALAIDGSQGAALLGLAALRERRGEYGAAVELLTVVEVPPGGREGRLRLALNRVRLGDHREGEEELAALAREGNDWVRSVAAQELARLLAARGDLGSAGALLAAASDALPCDPSLPIQAAFVAERAGSDLPLDLGGLSDCAEAEISPRGRYSRAPEAELRPLRERLAAAEGEWRAGLRRALGRAAE